MPDILTVDGVGSLGGRYRTCRKWGKGKGGKKVCRKFTVHRHKRRSKSGSPRRRTSARRRSTRTLRFNPLKICRYGAVVAGGNRRGRCPTKAEAMRRARRIFRKATGMKPPRGASITELSILASRAGVSLNKAAEMELRARQAGFTASRARNIGPVPIVTPPPQRTFWGRPVTAFDINIERRRQQAAARAASAALRGIGCGCA